MHAYYLFENSLTGSSVESTLPVQMHVKTQKLLTLLGQEWPTFGLLAITTLAFDQPESTQGLLVIWSTDSNSNCT